jgi:hypothetical protein
MKYQVETVDDSSSSLMATVPHGRVVACVSMCHTKYGDGERSCFERTAQIKSFVATPEGKAQAKVLREMGPMAHYRAICAEAKRLGLPTRYRADLTVHDRTHLSQIPNGESFGYVLRASGTHVFRAERRGNPDGFAYVERHFSPGYTSDKQIHCYWWDGTRLVALADSKALADKLNATLRERERAQYERRYA